MERAAAALCLAAGLGVGAVVFADEHAGHDEVRTGYVEVVDARLYYDQVGAGPAMVLLHDGLTHAVVWDRQVEAWKDRFTLVRYDRRGYGRSTAPTAPFSNEDDLLAVFDSLGIDSAVLTGMSAGARLAVDFTLAHPERVTGLILVSPVISGMGFSFHGLTRGGHLMPEQLPEDRVELANYYLDDDPYEIYAGNDTVRAEAHAMLAAYPHNADRANYRLPKQPSRPAVGALGEITVPTLVVTGEYDLPDIQAHAGAVAAGIRGAERVVIRNSGHRVSMEQPEEFNRVVTDFLAESAFFRTLQREGVAAAAAVFRRERESNPTARVFSEARVNQIAYQMLFAGDTTGAIELFRLNVEAYPTSSNVFDSYAEGLLAAGDTAGAIVNYEKSLELNPQNTNASTILEQIRAKH